jgi:hypothetical protein
MSGRGDRKGYWRDHYVVHAVERRRYFRAYYAAHRDGVLAQKRAYRASNRDVIKVARGLGVSQAAARALLGGGSSGAELAS